MQTELFLYYLDTFVTQTYELLIWVLRNLEWKTGVLFVYKNLKTTSHGLFQDFCRVTKIPRSRWTSDLYKYVLNCTITLESHVKSKLTLRFTSSSNLCTCSFVWSKTNKLFGCSSHLTIFRVSPWCLYFKFHSFN